MYIFLKTEVTGEWTELHKDELYEPYSSTNVIRVIKSRRMRWSVQAVRMVERKGAYRVLVGKPEGKRPLGRHSRKWEDNIKMYLRKVGWGHGLESSGS